MFKPTTPLVFFILKSERMFSLTVCYGKIKQVIQNENMEYTSCAKTNQQINTLVIKN